MTTPNVGRPTQMRLDVPAADHFDARGDPGWNGVAKFSLEWRIRHREWWLDMYPGCDEGSRRNLDWFVELAAKRESGQRT